MAASDDGSQDLLNRFAPGTRDILLQTAVASERERLEFLLTLAPANQGFAARRLNMGWDWEAAVKQLPGHSSTWRDDHDERAETSDGEGSARAGSIGESEEVEATDAALVLRRTPDARADSDLQPVAPDRPRQVISVRRADLRPNPVNATIYTDSLEDEHLRDLADHLARYGQREPIIVDSSLMILSGERRWQALRLIGAQYAYVVVDATDRSADEVEDLILDDFTLKRKPSLKEQLKVYQAAVRSYTRRYGRATGRPKKANKNLSSSWDSNRIHEEAAPPRVSVRARLHGRR